MLKNRYKVIGLMSGTSLDGLDILECEIWFQEQQWFFKLGNADTIVYPDNWQKILGDLSNLDQDELLRIDMDYSEYLNAQIFEFITKHNLTQIDLICSHGHTAKHQPNIGFTYQIGNHPSLAKHLNSVVVCDFRIQDVQLGGQGAPLVPIGDQFLFSNYEYCLNLGGFSNISCISDGERVAFDICPVNTVLNYYANRLGLIYDQGGKLSETGTVHGQLLSDLNNLEYYHKRLPKSLGIEWVHSEVIPRIETYSIESIDKLRTFIEHISIQINRVIRPESTVLVTGGGAYNTFLMDRIKATSNASFIIPESKLIEFKEALIFAFLGVLRVRGEVNCLSSVTGAIKNHSSGRIYPPEIAIT